MSIKKFQVSNTPNCYEAWPDLVLTVSGKMLCVFSECTHHCNRDYTRIMLTESFDRGRTWSPKRPLTESTKGLDSYYNCPRISKLNDNRLAIMYDKIPREQEHDKAATGTNYLMFSDDEGCTWTSPILTPLRGIVPDKLTETDNGRWIISAHYEVDDWLTQFMHYSDDKGKSWSDQILVAGQKGLKLCEASMLPMGNNVIVAFMRENSSMGYDCKKVISHDNGESWSDVIDFPLPGCHRPVSGFLNDSSIMITYRFIQGGSGKWGGSTQNFFAAMTDRESVLCETRKGASARILPVDFDRSPHADLGYSGWVQFPDGEIYIVNYIVDDAYDLGQIRGYSLSPEDFIINKQITRECLSCSIR